MSPIRMSGLVLATALLGACSHGGDHSRTSSMFQHLSITDDGDVIAHARDSSKARITAAGDLEIAGKPVSVSPVGRKRLQAYHADALALRHDAIATGKAGVQTGLHALDAVAKGLGSGDTDSIGAEVNGRADKVDALADTVCQDLARLYADQQQATAAIPAFGPYATIERHEVSDCHTD